MTDIYKKALRENVCEICVDSNENGSCSLIDSETCSLQLHSEKIVELVHSIQNGTYQQYYNLISANICKNHCILDDQSNCFLRDNANCSVDRYITLIVDTIHKVDQLHST